jgi:hypothetical protein
MAERRMIARSVCTSDAFRVLGAGAKSLYFQLILEADDDGCVGSPIGVMRADGDSDADLAALVDAGFLLRFPSGVVVITHWKIQNMIPPSRYTPGRYRDEVAQLTVTQSSAYEMSTEPQQVCRQPAAGVQANCYEPAAGVHTSCSKPAAEYSIVECSKVESSIDECSVGEESAVQTPSPAAASASERAAGVYLTDKEMERLGLLMGDEVRDAYIAHLAEYIAKTGKKYTDHASLIQKWWAQDKEKQAQQPKQSTAAKRKDAGAGESFATDDAFIAALHRSYGDKLPDGYEQFLGDKK